MPVAHKGMGVSRSDSLRSDASSKPRVSFNRDVHVKRISNRGGVAGLAGDSEGKLHPVLLRREPPSSEDPQELLRQVNQVVCKFSTLPTRGSAGRRGAAGDYSSLDRKRRESGRVEEERRKTVGRRNGGRPPRSSKLSPIVEKESPWENGSPPPMDDPPSERIMKLINGSPPPPPPQKEPAAKKKKKESLGQKVRQLFGRKKKTRPPSEEQAEESDPVKTRYTEYKGKNYTPDVTETDTTDAEREPSRGSRGGRKKGGWSGTTERGKSSQSSWFRSLERSGGGAGGGGRPRYFGDSEAEEADMRRRPSSEDSTGSVVFLHSAAVGDIPASGRLLEGRRRAQSREELSEPYRKTLSRSVSVLAPWAPRIPEDGSRFVEAAETSKSKCHEETRRNEIDYSTESSGTLGRPPKPPGLPMDSKPRGLLFTGPSFDESFGSGRSTPRSRPSGKTRK